MDQQGTPEPPPGPLEPGEEAAWIAEHCASLVTAVVDTVPHRLPRSARSASWQGDLPGHVRHLLGSLAAALVAEEEDILLEAGEWLAGALLEHGAEEDVLVEVWGAVGDAVRDCPSGWLLLARNAPGYAEAEATA